MLVTLIIMDGWGLNPRKDYNAIAQGNTPYFDYIWNNWPSATLEASGRAVGLPPGQMGNSEVGHMNLGAGRIVYQELQRIEPRPLPLWRKNFERHIRQFMHFTKDVARLYHQYIVIGREVRIIDDIVVG